MDHVGDKRMDDAPARRRASGLSKSRITAFEQCPRKLWLSVHRPDLAGEVDVGAEARFSVGHEIGAIACGLLPHGVMVEAEPDLAAALAQTQTLLHADHQVPIFEATFAHEGVLVRVDVLSPDGEGGWGLAEVKSTTQPKAYHLGDLATQVWALRHCGVSLTSAVIRHVDTGFILERDGDYTGLFRDRSLLDLAEPLVANRHEVVADALAVLAGPEPVREIGDHCSAPFVCAFGGHCGRDLPPGPQWPIDLLPVARQSG